MIDVTNVFNNSKYGIIVDNKIVNVVLIHPNDIDSMLPQVIEQHQGTGSVEITGELDWLGVGCTKDGDNWLPPKSHDSWVWNGTDWEAPIPKPEGEHIWNEILKAWIPIP